MNAPPELIDLPTPSEPFPGGWKRFRIRPSATFAYPFVIEASGGWFCSWSRYANASSWDAAMEMIPSKKREKVRYIRFARESTE